MAAGGPAAAPMIAGAAAAGAAILVFLATCEYFRKQYNEAKCEEKPWHNLQCNVLQATYASQCLAGAASGIASGGVFLGPDGIQRLLEAMSNQQGSSNNGNKNKGWGL